MIEIEVYESDTAGWELSFKRGGSSVDLANATAVLDVPYLGITSASMTVDGSADTATYSPSASDTEETCYRVPAFVTVTFAGGEEETFDFLLTVKPKDLWELASPTTSTSTSSSTSTSTTTTL